MISLQAVKKRLTGRGAFQTILHTSAANLLIMILSTLTSIVTARLFGVSGKGRIFGYSVLADFAGGSRQLRASDFPHFQYEDERGQSDRIRQGRLSVPNSRQSDCRHHGLDLSSRLAWAIFGGRHSIARWYTVLTLPMLLAVNLLAALTQSIDKFSLYNGLRLYVPLSNLVGLLVLWSIGKLTIPYASFAFFATSLMVIFWSLYRLRRELTFNWFKPFTDRIVFKSLFGYGGRVFGVELLGTLYSQCDKLIILSLLQTEGFRPVYGRLYAVPRVQCRSDGHLERDFPEGHGHGQGQNHRNGRQSVPALVPPHDRSGHSGHDYRPFPAGSPVRRAVPGSRQRVLPALPGMHSRRRIVDSRLVLQCHGRPGLVVIRQAVALAITVGLFFVFTPMYGLNGIAFALLLGAVIRIVITIAAMRWSSR